MFLFFQLSQSHNFTDGNVQDIEETTDQLLLLTKSKNSLTSNDTSDIVHFISSVSQVVELKQTKVRKVIL